MVKDYLTGLLGEVEDDDMNVICRVITFLKANFKADERFIRRLEEIADL